MPSIFKNTRFDFRRKNDEDGSIPSPRPYNLSKDDATAESLFAGTSAGAVMERATTIHRTNPPHPDIIQGNPLTFLCAWLISAVLAIFIPWIQWSVKKHRYQNYMYNNNGQGYNYQQAPQGEMLYDINNCKWWKFRCQPIYINQNGDFVNNQQAAPSWWNAWGTTQEQMDQNIQQGIAPTSLKFVYAWQMLMFSAVVFYGFLAIVQRRETSSGLMMVLLVWANYSFLSMLMLAAGSILSDEQDLGNGGFYGQFAVLLFMTDFWYTLYGLAFALVLWVRSTMATKRIRSLEKAAASIPTQVEMYNPVQIITPTGSEAVDQSTDPVLEYRAFNGSYSEPETEETEKGTVTNYQAYKEPAPKETKETKKKTVQDDDVDDFVKVI